MSPFSRSKSSTCTRVYTVPKYSTFDQAGDRTRHLRIGRQISYHVCTNPPLHRVNQVVCCINSFIILIVQLNFICIQRGGGGLEFALLQCDSVFLYCSISVGKTNHGILAIPNFSAVCNVCIFKSTCTLYAQCLFCFLWCYSVQTPPMPSSRYSMLSKYPFVIEMQ